MKRFLLLLSAMIPLSVIQAGEPSAMFGQELARIAQPNAINLDIVSPSPSLRVGLDKGEIIVDYVGIQSLSYKSFIDDSLALYGGIGINSTGILAPQATNIIVGAAYTINNNDIRFNINPVINIGNGVSQTDLYLGAFMKFDGIKNKKMMLGAQLHSDLTASTSNITLGLRWLARENFIIDLALFNNNQLQFPGLFAVNMSF